MNSLTKENYLKALFHLANSENEISVKDLSDNLGIRMPSVNSMMKNFQRKAGSSTRAINHLFSLKRKA